MLHLLARVVAHPETRLDFKLALLRLTALLSLGLQRVQVWHRTRTAQRVDFFNDNFMQTVFGM